MSFSFFCVLWLQMDMRGDVSGFLSYHPNAPLMSLHHFDMADPIFPTTNRAESARRIMKPAKFDQTRLMQQVICHHRPLHWSLSVSWGYSAQIYERIMPRSYLQNPIETFMRWAETTTPPFWTFDVRPRSRDPCEAPHFFFFRTVKRLPPRNEIMTTYHRQWKRPMGPCLVGGNRTADQISRIQVISPAGRRLRVIFHFIIFIFNCFLHIRNSYIPMHAFKAHTSNDMLPNSLLKCYIDFECINILP